MTQDGRDRTYTKSGGKTWVPMSERGSLNPMGAGEFQLQRWGSTDPYKSAVGAGYTGPQPVAFDGYRGQDYVGGETDGLDAIRAWAEKNGLTEMSSGEGQTTSSGYFRNGDVIPESIVSGQFGDSDFMRNGLLMAGTALGGHYLSGLGGGGGLGGGMGAGATGIDSAALGLDGAMGAGGGFGGAGAAGGAAGGAWAPASDSLFAGAGGADWAAGNTMPGLYGGAELAPQASNFWTSLGLPATTGKAVGAALPLVGTALQLGSAGRAQGALQSATNSANDLQKYMYDTTRQDNMPALNARNGALGQIDALLKNPNSLTSQPGYQFGLDQGTKTLNNGAAARGMSQSGQTDKARMQFGQDYAGTKLNESFNRLSTLAGLGQAGAGQIAGAGANYANQVGNNTTAQGSANGLMQLGMGNALANAANGLSAYGTRQKWWGEPG